MTVRSAVVLLSGGLDSTTVLALAHEQGYRTCALSVDYGQRHRAELDAAFRVAKALGAAEHKVARFDLRAIGGSALTDPAMEVPTSGVRAGVIPITYVPARNTILLSLALAYAEVREAEAIFFGANAIDYAGYPDCRPEYVSAYETMANLATRAGVEGRRLRLLAPIIGMSKPDIIREGARLGIDYGMTVSCYQADTEGRACGVCDSCRLRRAGFERAGLPDPTRYR